MISEEIEYSIEDIDKIAKKVIDFSREIKVWAFYGEMGAGKTTLIKAICKVLKVIDNVSSPTFTIINEYMTIEKKTVFHFDFYRLKHETEALDLGYEDYLYGSNLCFIEWPEKIEGLLPIEKILVSIKIADNKRIVTLKK